MDQLESEYFIHKSWKLTMLKLVTRIVSNQKKQCYVNKTGLKQFNSPWKVGCYCFKYEGIFRKMEITKDNFFKCFLREDAKINQSQLFGPTFIGNKPGFLY